MRIRVFSGAARILSFSVASLFLACSSPTSDSVGTKASPITGTVQFRANGGGVPHSVYMAAFFSHAGSAEISSNIIDLGMTALQPQDFSLTPDFPTGAVAGDLMVFYAWVDADDNGVFNGEQRQPLITEAAGDKVFFSASSLLVYQPDGWHFEDSEADIGDLYEQHTKTGTKLISISMN